MPILLFNTRHTFWFQPLWIIHLVIVNTAIIQNTVYNFKIMNVSPISWFTPYGPQGPQSQFAGYISPIPNKQHNQPQHLWFLKVFCKIYFKNVLMVYMINFFQHEKFKQWIFTILLSWFTFIKSIYKLHFTM